MAGNSPCVGALALAPFCENGLSLDAGVARWQNHQQPLWGALASGGHLNGDILAMLQAGGWHLIGLDRARISGPRPWTPRRWGEVWLADRIKLSRESLDKLVHNPGQALYQHRKQLICKGFQQTACQTGSHRCADQAGRCTGSKAARPRREGEVYSLR
jgi:hypothetical protein